MPLTTRLAECKPVADLIPDVTFETVGGRGHAGPRGWRWFGRLCHVRGGPMGQRVPTGRQPRTHRPGS